MPFVQGRHEQSLAHLAIGYAKANRRRTTLAVTASIGPGALNLVTAAGLATVNRLPVLLLPGDTYATRRQGPVLQQLRASGRGRRHGQRRVPADLAVLRPDQPARAVVDRAAAGDAGVDRPGRHRRRGDVAAPGRPVATPSTSRPSSSTERDWVIRRPIPDPDEVAAGRRAASRGAQADHHRRRRRHLLRRHRGARAARRRRRHPRAGDLGR